MKTKYKYLQFVKVVQKSKTSVWSCWTDKGKNRGIEIGEVKWYTSWRRYCFFPFPETIFDKSCMEDICDFIGQLGGKDKKRS